MNNLGIYPKLTKDYILERISEEEIMWYYTGVPVIEENFYGNAFTSPFRIDTLPTCNYYYSSKDNKLRLRDFGGASNGHLDRIYNADIFDAVGFFNKLNPNIPQHFNLILHIIAKDFRLHKYADDEEEVKKISEFVLKQRNTKERLKIIKVVPRSWNKGDENYWYKKYGISYSTLKKHKVYPVQELYIEDRVGFLNRYYLYKYNDPAYAYYGGKENGIDIWKIYFPMRKQKKNATKIITNKSFVQGFDTFLPCRIGIITKSYKDVMALKEFGLQSVTLASESTPLSRDEFFKLKSYCDFVVSLLDYDLAGVRMANYLKRTYNVKPFMLTRGYGTKDFSDFRETYGKERTIMLINQAIDSISDMIEYSKQLNKQTLWI